MIIAKTYKDKYIVLSDDKSKLVSIKVDSTPLEAVSQTILDNAEKITWNGWAGNNYFKNYTVVSGYEHSKFKGVVREFKALTS